MILITHICRNNITQRKYLFSNRAGASALSNNTPTRKNTNDVLFRRSRPCRVRMLFFQLFQPKLQLVQNLSHGIESYFFVDASPRNEDFQSWHFRDPLPFHQFLRDIVHVDFMESNKIGMFRREILHLRVQRFALSTPRRDELDHVYAFRVYRFYELLFVVQTMDGALLVVGQRHRRRSTRLSSSSSCRPRRRPPNADADEIRVSRRRRSRSGAHVWWWWWWCCWCWWCASRANF